MNSMNEVKYLNVIKNNGAIFSQYLYEKSRLYWPPPISLVSSQSQIPRRLSFKPADSDN